MECFDNIGEFRRAKDTAEFFMNIPNSEQVEWERDLLRRLSVAEHPTVTVSVLDMEAVSRAVERSNRPLRPDVLNKCPLNVPRIKWRAGGPRCRGHLTEVMSEE